MGLKESNAQHRQLVIRYDLLQLNLLQVERTLNEVDIQLDNSWWQKLWRGWVHETEQNELDNLAAGPVVCRNCPPPRV